MVALASLLVALVAAIHVYILVLEMFLWRTPRGLKAFRMDQDFADRSATLAANQGLYNGFLAAGLIWGLLAADPVGFQVKVFFLALHHRRRPVRRRDGQSADPAGPGVAGRARARRGRLSPDRPPPDGALSATSQEPTRGSRRTRHSRGLPMTPLSPSPIAPPPVDDPDDDDRLIGRVLSRREVLALMGLASVGVVAAACAPGATGSAVAPGSAAAAPAPVPSASAAAIASATANALPACVVVPELTEGPYYVDEKIERSDIRIDSADGAAVEGALLRIDWVVSQVDGSACIPLEGVLVDVWHCDALGNYSDVQGEVGHDYLRGYVHTDADGKATITTIYPGLVLGSGGPHPLQDPHGSGARRAASNSRHSCSSTTPSANRSTARASYASKGTAGRPERGRRHLPAEPGTDPAERGPGR